MTRFPLHFFQTTNLYSDLGGNLGFYLGLSIIGAFELCELLMDLLISSIATPVHKRTTKKSAKNVGQASHTQNEGKDRENGKGDSSTEKVKRKGKSAGRENGNVV